MISIHESAEENGEVWLRKSSALIFAAICVASLIVSLSLAMSLNNNLTAYDPRAYDQFRDLFVWS
jgi:hypothetical protein